MKRIFYLLSLLLLFSCGKEGPGGKATIEGYVKHNNSPIPGAIVYIKYGTKKFPGSNITLYDASVAADTKAHYEFANMRSGHYYLFSVGFDSTTVETVSGNAPAVVPGKTSTVTVTIPVAK